MAKTFKGFDSFAKGFSKLADDIALEVAEEVAKAAVQGFTTLVITTPVDTGEARSNWLVGIDNIPGGKVSPHSPGKGLGVGETANASSTIKIGIDRINRFKPEHRSIFIVNNTPYIDKLDNGSSAQAPNGMTGAGLAVINSKLEKINLKAVKGF